MIYFGAWCSYLSVKISFEEAYSEAVKDALKILGNHVSKIVTDYVEQKYSIRIGMTADNPSVLDEALDKTIDGGRLIVERRLIRLLFEKLGMEDTISRNDSSGFGQKVLAARKKYDQDLTNRRW